MEVSFSQRVTQLVAQSKSCILLGVDPDISRLPTHLQQQDSCKAIETFCMAHIEASAPYVCGIKIQMAFFECLGSKGIAVVERLITCAKARNLLVVIDAKRGDIANSASAYARAYLHPDSPLAGDAVTVHPWLGEDAVQPFVDTAKQQGGGVFVLVKTSNPGADQFQPPHLAALAAMINRWNSQNDGFGSIGAVVGATRSKEEITNLAERLHSAWLLVPGVGTQGGDFQHLAAMHRTRGGVLIPVSRAILYASDGEDFASAGAAVARQLQQGLEYTMGHA